MSSGNRLCFAKLAICRAYRVGHSSVESPDVVAVTGDELYELTRLGSDWR